MKREWQRCLKQALRRVIAGGVAKTIAEKERRKPQYYQDVTIMAAFCGGEVVVVRFGLYGAYVSISSMLTSESIKQGMAELLVGWELRDRLPQTFPQEWHEENGTYFHRQIRDNGWYVFAKPMSQGGCLSSLTPDGRLISYYISEGVGIEIGYEIPFNYGDGASQTMRTFRYAANCRAPEWFEKFMVEIVMKLFDGKLICALSADPYTFETIYTRIEAEKLEGFHLVPVCPVIYLSNGRIERVLDKETVDHPNHENGTFLFQTGKNVYGVMEDREGFGYMLPFTFKKIHYYPQGLPVSQLASEIESIRVV